MRRVNLHTAELTYDDDDPDGFHSGYIRLHPALAAEMMAGKFYELPAGQSNCPYHYEFDEEWLLVLDGRLTVRHPEGEDELGSGDLVCFPAGPAGAHRLTNRGDEPVRMLIVSTWTRPAVAVYPDSGKVGVFTADPADKVIVRRADAVDYWDGER